MCFSNELSEKTSTVEEELYFLSNKIRLYFT